MFLYNKTVEFKEWINKKYIAWRGDSRNTLTDFAAYIGISRQVMDKWMNRGTSPSTRMLQKLALIYPEVYEVLDLPQPVDELMRSLPPDLRNSLGAACFEYQYEIDRRGITSDSPEARQIATEIFAKHGLNITVTDDTSI